MLSTLAVISGVVISSVIHPDICYWCLLACGKRIRETTKPHKNLNHTSNICFLGLRLKSTLVLIDGVNDIRVSVYDWIFVAIVLQVFGLHMLLCHMAVRALQDVNLSTSLIKWLWPFSCYHC